MAVEALGHGLGVVTGKNTQGGTSVLRRLEQPRNHGGQEEPDVRGVSLKRGQLALLLVQAAFEGRPDVLELGVGKTRQGQELVGQVWPDTQSRQYALDVGNGGEYLARLDLRDLALRDAAAACESFAGEASGTPRIPQGCCQLVLAAPEFFWFEDGNGLVPWVVGVRDSRAPGGIPPSEVLV